MSIHDLALVSFLAKVTVILAAGLFGTMLTRRSRAAVRHSFLAASLGVLLLLPIGSAVVTPVHIVVPIAAPQVELPTKVSPRFAVPALPTEDLRPTVIRNDSWLSGHSLSDFLFTAWIIGAVLSLLPMIFGLWQVRAVRRSGLPWRQGHSITQRLALDAGIHRRVEVLLHEALPGPMTCGVSRPAIILQVDAQMWDAEELDRAIVHELEHVRRGDWLSHSVARFVCAVYWFHPLAWIVWRQLGLEAERACDDAVVGQFDATAYADQLVGLARRLSSARKTPALAMANRSDLSARVRAVLDLTQRRGRAGVVATALAATVAMLIVFTISPLTVGAQAAPTFEVASVKPSGPPGRLGIGWFGTYPGGRIVAANCTLGHLISIAFDTELFQFPGAPGWIYADDGMYDIEARPPATSASSKANPPYAKAPPNDEQRRMLQTLLMERFGMKFHREIKESQVYLLVRNGKELKLQPPKDPNTYPWAGGANGGAPFGDGMRGENITMAQLAKRLTPYMQRPVLDQTGIDGSFDFKYEYAVGDAPRADQITTILASVQGLGLKLESSKAQVETVIVDHVERPSAN